MDDSEVKIVDCREVNRRKFRVGILLVPLVVLGSAGVTMSGTRVHSAEENVVADFDKSSIPDVVTPQTSSMPPAPRIRTVETVHPSTNIRDPDYWKPKPWEALDVPAGKTCNTTFHATPARITTFSLPVSGFVYMNLQKRTVYKKFVGLIC